MDKSTKNVVVATAAATAVVSGIVGVWSHFKSKKLQKQAEEFSANMQKTADEVRARSAKAEEDLKAAEAATDEGEAAMKAAVDNLVKDSKKRVAAATALVEETLGEAIVASEGYKKFKLTDQWVNLSSEIMVGMGFGKASKEELQGKIREVWNEFMNSSI